MMNKKVKNRLSSSFLTTSPEKGKITALKLLNKYADSFNSLKEENSSLKQQINDLNLNLKINKSIIENFFSNLKLGEKTDFFIKNITQENKILSEQKINLEKKNSELIKKIHLNEQSFLDMTSQTREENEKLKTKIFLLEQSCQKKNNIIKHQNSKLNLKTSKLKHEIYITNPSKAVNNINNELIKYKNMYKELTSILKEDKYNLEKYEKKIIELQNENQNLRNEYKTYIFNSNKERETLMNTIQNGRKLLTKNNNSRNYEKNILNSIYPKTSEDISDLDIFNDLYFKNKINRKQFEHEDFLDVLKNVGLNLEKFEILCKMKQYIKFKEIIEMLLNLVKEKERLISILQKENQNLNENNCKLNEENILYKNNKKNKDNINTTVNLYKEYIIKNNQKEINYTHDIIDNNPININIKEINNKIIINDKNKENNNDTVINNKNGKIISTAVKIPNDLIDNKKMNKKYLVGSIVSITSSEFREGCPGPDSFLSTVKFDDMNGTQKTNGLKEIQKNYKENNL